MLREAIRGRAIGTPYTEDRFREMLNAAIRPLYEARGRVRVAFPEIRTEPAKDVQGLHVYVTVDEGAELQLGEGRASTAPRPLESGGVAAGRRLQDRRRGQFRHA